jgi:hypothetical protein
MMSHIFAEGAIHADLVALLPIGAAPKPCDQIHVEAQGDLLRDRTKQRAAPRVAPVSLFRDVARIDLIVGERG